MQEKKNQEKAKPLLELDKTVTEILVANGRSFQPFIRTFSYTGENISKSSLGTLVGVFEVDERSEDSAYIVNFLASVAKKEYFNNPRRGAIESFEAALHKVNLALAELVKHGNVAWLGKLHGALGILEKNNLHFSVTGRAQILLFRNENIADISEGLASDESHIHPIKTFVEVSSGRLMIDDQLLFSSPELFALFSLDELEKNALRMGKERFVQFLKTALINELDMSGVIIVDVSEGVLKEASKSIKKKVEILPNISNVFSQSAFFSKKAESSHEEAIAAPEKELTPEEYVDTKTGHIYVQGDVPGDKEESLFWENLQFRIQDTFHAFRSFFISQGKWIRKAKKQGLIAFDSLSEQTKFAARKTARSIRKQWRKRRAEVKPEERVSIPAEETFVEPTQRDTFYERPITDIPVPSQPAEFPVAQPLDIEVPPEKIYRQNTTIGEALQEKKSEPHTQMPTFLKEKLANFYQRGETEKLPTESSPQNALSMEKLILGLGSVSQSIKSGSRKFFGFVSDAVSILWQNSLSFYRKLEPLHKKVLWSILFIFLVAGASGFYFLKLVTTPLSSPETKAPEQAPLVPAQSTLTDKNVTQTDAPLTVTNAGAAIVSTVILDSDVYIVTPGSILHVRENKSYPLPGASSASFAAAMDDLRLIFVLTENKALYAWSPINKSFTQNTLSLPENSQAEGIGTYLTYLYVLDSTTDQVYRFPRAEGGFGQGTAWLRESVTIEQDSKMTVNETIFLSPTESSVQAYFRGRLTRDLELTTTPLSVTSIYTHPGLTNIYALDRDNKRVIVWNQEGNLVAQYSHDRIGEGKNISINERTQEILLATDSNTLLSFKLNR